MTTSNRLRERSVPALERAPVRTPRRSRFWPVELYRSAVGKKYVMAVTGIVLMGYVFAHMVGNLKLYTGVNAAGIPHLDEYGEFLRNLLVPIFPRTVALWGMRLVLLASTVLHVHAAYALTRMNRDAKPVKYQGSREYVAATFAARTMRWTGIIVLLFVLFHLADLTWGVPAVNPDFVRGEVQANMVASMSRWPVAVLYIVANLALGLHLYHGSWSLFQSLGWNKRRFNNWRRWFAIGFAVLVTAGNITFPLAILTGLVP